nr:MAG TPA: hypothetical protein [Bacteriophage sp.]
MLNEMLRIQDVVADYYAQLASVRDESKGLIRRR